MFLIKTTVQFALAIILLFRIIPACAGSTRQPGVQLPPEQDHPRMRGVHVVLALSSASWVGSSPHARGPLAINTEDGGLDRIIPACAGSTDKSGIVQTLIEDHPRMRGVHSSESPW